MAETKETFSNSIEIKKNNFNFKNLVIIPALISSLTLFLILAFLIFIVSKSTEKFMKDYRKIAIKNTAKIISYLTNEIEIKNILREKSKEKWINSIGIADKNGIIFFHSNNDLIGKSISNDIKYHLWKFSPDGSPIPFEKFLKNEIAIISYTPIYDSSTKSLKYFLIIKFERFIFKPFLIFKKLPYQTFIIEIILISVFLILISFFATISFLSKKFKKEEKGLIETLSEFKNIDINNLPKKIEYNEKIQNTILKAFADSFNALLENIYRKLKYEEEKTKKIISATIPLIIKKPDDKIKVIVKEENINQNSLLYFEDKIKPINNYSINLYHLKKENPSLFFREIEISNKRKTYFIFEIQEKELNKKLFIISFLNYFIEKYSPNVSSTISFLENLNNFVKQFNLPEIKFNILFALLDTDLNYIEISSCNISPLIFYKFSEDNFYFYNFDSFKIGEVENEKFIEKLKKASFKLEKGDTIGIFNKEIENIYNINSEKYEFNKIIEIIKNEKLTTADVITEKIVESIKKFKIDFSKIGELLILIFKKEWVVKKI